MSLGRTVANLFGYDLIRHKKSPTAASHLMNLVSRHGVDVVLDVGANEGQFARQLRKRGYNGLIHSFEPGSQAFAHLERNSSDDPEWFVHQAALGSEPRMAKLNVPKSSDLSSLLEASPFGKERFNNIEPLDIEEVPVITLEHFFEQESELSARRVLLKMDTQGYDLEVFKGLGSCLDNVCCLLSELSVQPIYADMPTYIDALKVYEGAGFTVTGLYPVSRDEDFSVIEFDCFMIRKGGR